MDCKTAQQMILPYIQRKLSDRELENFICHIRNCPECHEELEIYFTIYFALERLDEGGQVSYDIQKLLVDDLKDSEHQIRRRKYIHFYRNILFVLAEAVLLLVLFTQIQMWTQKSSIQETTLYRLMYRGPDEEELRLLKEEIKDQDTQKEQVTQSSEKAAVQSEKQNKESESQQKTKKTKKTGTQKKQKKDRKAAVENTTKKSG